MISQHLNQVSNIIRAGKGNASEMAEEIDSLYDEARLTATLAYILVIGHNERCTFCGLKDQAAENALKLEGKENGR